MKMICIEAPQHTVSTLRSERITAADIALINQVGIKDWSGKEFDTDLLLRYGKWVANEDRSVIFKALGGGAFEIPKMYDLVYKKTTVRIECGGSGAQASRLTKNDDGSLGITVFVTRIQIPRELLHEQDSVLALAAEAFAVELLGSTTAGTLTVEFNL